MNCPAKPLADFTPPMVETVGSGSNDDEIIPDKRRTGNTRQRIIRFVFLEAREKLIHIGLRSDVDPP